MRRPRLYPEPKGRGGAHGAASSKLLQGPEAGEMPEPTLDPSLVATPSLFRRPAKVAEEDPMWVGQEFALFVYPRCLRMKTREKSPWERRSYSTYPILE